MLRFKAIFYIVSSDLCLILSNLGAVQSAFQSLESKIYQTFKTKGRGGEGQRRFEQSSKKLHFSYTMASLRCAIKCVVSGKNLHDHRSRWSRQISTLLPTSQCQIQKKCGFCAEYFFTEINLYRAYLRLTLNRKSWTHDGVRKRSHL